MNAPQEWKIWQRVLFADAIASALKDIPKHWKLTPLRGKRPYRKNWQTEAPLPHNQIATRLLDGEESINSKGKAYRAYISGYGICTGDASGGLVALDIDGSSAEPLLQAISGGDLPKTLSWTSGKPGRRQILFQVPPDVQALLKDFNHKALREWGELKSDCDLDFRYNNCQSALPPSLHPDTGAYIWINSPADCAVAIAPVWLCELLLSLANQEKAQAEARQQETEASLKAAELRRQQRQQQPGVGGAAPLEIFLSRDDQNLINSGAGQGERDNKGFKLAANLKATSDRLQLLGIPYEGNPEQLFEEFAARCLPSLPSRDISRIWKSASKKSKPSLTDDALEKRYSYWQWQQAGCPQDDPREPDPQEYKTYCDRLEEEEQVEAAQETESCSQWVKALLSKLIKGTAKKVRRLRRAGKSDDVLAIAQPKLHTLKYVSGSLPSPKDAEALGYPKINFEQGQRHQIWAEAVEKGWQHIQDISAPGLGKSYEAGNARLGDFEVNKIFYFASNHRNPTVATIEAEFVDVRVRNSGLLEDPTRLTPLGNPYIVWPKNEPPNLPGNCHKTEVFSLLRKKNFSNLEGSSGEDSPVCANCHLLNACKGSEGAGFGAKHQRLEDLAHPRNRLHPDSAPDTSEFNFAQTVNFWDEAGTLINAMSSVSVALPDFDKLWGDLEQRSPEIHSKLADLRLKLRPLLTKELKQPFRGWDDAAVRALLPTPPENLADIICELELNSPDLNEFIEPLDGVEFTSAQSSEERRMLKRLNQSLRQETYRQSRKNLEDLPLNWLIPFLKVWNGEAGSLRSDFGILSIFNRNTRHSDVAKASKSNIYLDATENPKNLALKLGIQANELLIIEQEIPSFENLRIIQVCGFGNLSKDRSDSLKERLAIFKDELKRRHPDIAFLEWLAHADEGDGAHFREGRGSNQYLDISALAGFGVPYQNIGHLQALYQTLTGQQATLDGNDPEFQRFIDTHVHGEIIQEVGRLRAHLRKSERLTYYFVGDYDLNFLREAYPGASIESIEAYSICSQAGTATQQVRARILDAFRHLSEVGEKITTTAIAEIANVSQGRVSQIASDFGGWAVFKKLLASLYTSLYRKTNNSSETSDPENQWFAATYLPLVVNENPDPVETVNAVLNMVRAVGSKVFEQILAIATPATKAELLLKMMDILPIEMQREIIGGSTS